MVKVKATELAKRAAMKGLQMMGAFGRSVECGMEELVRAATAGTVVGGRAKSSAMSSQSCWGCEEMIEGRLAYVAHRVAILGAGMVDASVAYAAAIGRGARVTRSFSRRWARYRGSL